MANVDRPQGFYPLYRLGGGEIQTKEFIVTTGQTIYRGDPVKRINSGTVSVIAAADAHLCIGIAADYVDDSASAGGKKIRVYIDPNIVFGVQCTTGQTPAAADIFGSADMVTYAAGKTSAQVPPGQSIMELDAISTGAAMFMVLGLVDKPDNAWGEHADVEVTFIEHSLKHSSAVGV